MQVGKKLANLTELRDFRNFQVIWGKTISNYISKNIINSSDKSGDFHVKLSFVQKYINQVGTNLCPESFQFV